MNAFVEKPEAALSSAEVHLMRSKIVDKCAQVERHILKLIDLCGASVSPNALLSQKIEALKRALEASPEDPARSSILAILEELGAVSDLRSELVHSTVSTATVERRTVAVFRRANEQDAGSGRRLIMTRESLKVAHDRASNSANKLKRAADQF